MVGRHQLSNKVSQMREGTLQWGLSLLLWKKKKALLLKFFWWSLDWKPKHGHFWRWNIYICFAGPSWRRRQRRWRCWNSKKVSPLIQAMAGVLKKQYPKDTLFQYFISIPYIYRHDWISIEYPFSWQTNLPSYVDFGESTHSFFDD